MTAETKARAVARLAAGESAKALAVELGVSRGTVYRWARAAGAQLDTTRTAAATAGAVARWAARRQALADDIGEAAEAALALCSESLGAGDARGAQSAATTLGILIDKAQLLSGDVTSRQGTVDPAAAVAAGRARVHLLRPSSTSKGPA